MGFVEFEIPFEGNNPFFKIFIASPWRYKKIYISASRNNVVTISFWVNPFSLEGIASLVLSRNKFRCHHFLENPINMLLNTSCIDDRWDLKVVGLKKLYFLDEFLTPNLQNFPVYNSETK